MSYKMWSGKWHNLLPLPDLNGIPGRTFDVHTSLEFANILGNLVQQTSKQAASTEWNCFNFQNFLCHDELLSTKLQKQIYCGRPSIVLCTWLDWWILGGFSTHPLSAAKNISRTYAFHLSTNYKPVLHGSQNEGQMCTSCQPGYMPTYPHF